MPEVRRQLAAMVPLRRLAGADEIARAVLFLAGGDGSFMTGEELAVNGGLSAFLQRFVDALAGDPAPWCANT